MYLKYVFENVFEVMAENLKIWQMMKVYALEGLSKPQMG